MLGHSSMKALVMTVDGYMCDCVVMLLTHRGREPNVDGRDVALDVVQCVEDDTFSTYACVYIGK